MAKTKVPPPRPWFHPGLADRTLEDLSTEFAGKALEQLLLEGGAGLRGAIFLAMSTALRWKELKEEKC